jgi:hypothetical protein
LPITNSFGRTLPVLLAGGAEELNVVPETKEKFV